MQDLYKCLAQTGKALYRSHRQPGSSGDDTASKTKLLYGQCVALRGKELLTNLLIELTSTLQGICLAAESLLLLGDNSYSTVDFLTTSGYTVHTSIRFQSCTRAFNLQELCQVPCRDRLPNWGCLISPCNIAICYYLL